MTSRTAPHVLIIGGGFAGVATAIHLITQARTPFALTLVESRAQVGRGVAYSTRYVDHLVNGPAKNFSLYPDRPLHLADWLAANAASTAWSPADGTDWQDSFPPRHVYGDYVQATLAAALDHAPVRVDYQRVVGRAVDLIVAGDGYEATLADGRRLVADTVVLATGLFNKKLSQSFEVAPALIDDGRVVQNIWDEKPAAAATRTDGDVLIVGSGLSALDAMILADRQGFNGRFVSLSRRGQLVQPRGNVEPWPVGLAADALPRSLRELLRIVRPARRAIQRNGDSLQRLAPAVRPHVPALWAQASTDERRRFIRHLRPYWEITLHRAPPVSAAWLSALTASGRHDARTGRINKLAAHASGGVEVTWLPRGADLPQTFVVDRVLNAGGFEFDWQKIDDPLIRAVLRRGLARVHATRFGIDLDPATGALSSHGVFRPQSLYAVGHPARGAAWESNAIGEQVGGALNAARAIAEKLGVPAYA
ncbi:FAD/NAD(P)-binding protein [Alcaligenaceae bacterium A4P071]|nr:FAD/NAD(P)-binding protein [Alcaligenaceae bacterium A4P071]